MRDATFGLDRGSHRDELGGILAPLVVVDIEPDPHHPIGSQLGRLFFHAGHGQLTGVVHRLGEFGELLALSPLPGLNSGVIDRRAHHEPEWMESHFLDQQELIDRQVRGKKAMLQFLEAMAGGLGKPLGVVTHVCPPVPMFARACLAVWLWAASALSAARTLAIHASTSTWSLRMRIPPEACPMVQSNPAPSTTASKWSVP